MKEKKRKDTVTPASKQQQQKKARYSWEKTERIHNQLSIVQSLENTSNVTVHTGGQNEE